MTRLGAAIALDRRRQDWLLPSFLAPVLGGDPAPGGALAVIGTVPRAALVTAIRAGSCIMQIGNFWLQLFLGVILLLAVMPIATAGVSPPGCPLRRR